MFPLDDNLVTKGGALLESYCGECHAERQSKDVPNAEVWITPVKAVGTDPTMVINSERMSASGLLAGAQMPPQPPQPPAVLTKLPNPAKTGDILATAVVGSLLGEVTSPTPSNGVWRAIAKDLAEGALILNPTPAYNKRVVEFINAKLIGMFRSPVPLDAGAAYESRVLWRA